MAEYTDKWTDDQLVALERRLSGIYKEAQDDLADKAAEYWANFQKRYTEQWAAYQAGEYTDAEWQAWVNSQAARGHHWEKMRDQMAGRLTNSNVMAASYINGTTGRVFAENANYAAYQIENLTGSTSFELLDENTVRLLSNGPRQILPVLSISLSKDEMWNAQKLQNSLLQGLLQGESIGQITKRFEAVTNMNHKAAVRNARTAVTGAQNAGRQESYDRAKAMGIEVLKEWIATEDERTRESHKQLDGVRVAEDKDFPNGCKYPGDPLGPGDEVYNCRCTVRAILPKYNGAARLSTYYDEKTHSYQTRYNDVDSYNAWKAGKQDARKWYEEPDDDEIKANSELWFENMPEMPPLIDAYKNYDDYVAAVDEYYSKYGDDYAGQMRDLSYQYESKWAFEYYDQETRDLQIDRAKRFDSTIARLCEKYDLPLGDDLVIGEYGRTLDFISEIQRERADSYCAGQCWHNYDDRRYVIGYSMTHEKGVAADIERRANAILTGDRLLGVFENDSAEGVAIHEYGHIMSDYLTYGMIHGDQNSVDYWEWYKSLSKDQIKDGISSYAATNRAEFEAECFAELQFADPRPIAVKYGEFLETAIQHNWGRVDD